MKVLIILVAGVLVNSSCSPAQVHWQHPERPGEQWQRDYRSCQRAAERHLERDGRYHQTMPGQGSSYEDQMRVYTASKAEKRLVGDCMRKMGYRPAP